MEIQYIRLKNGSDIIAQCEDIGTKIVVTKPMRVYIETILEESRQTVILDEYLPQKLVTIKSLEIPKEEIMFYSPLSKGFVQDYESISSACYDEEEQVPVAKKPKQTNDDDNIISLVETIEALRSRRGKLLN